MRSIFRFEYLSVWILIVLIGMSPSSLGSAAPRLERIINGTASDTPWPWMVSLAFEGTDLAREHFCGGTLIDARYVITSAHCVVDLVKTPEEIKVVLGRTNLTDTAGTVISADGIILFPTFNSNSPEDDLALIRLSTAVPQYQALPLLSPDEAFELAPDTLGLILGWGVTDPFVPIRPARLQEAWISIISDAECADRLGLDFYPMSMLCAGVLSSTPYEIDGIDACYGDSGGPLMLETSNGWRLGGITSWGFVCASDRYWGVYTRATAFYDWVNLALTHALYVIEVPTISGTPVVGKKLRCNPGTFHGVSTEPRQIQWRQLKSGRTLSKKSVYKVKAADIGKSLRCEVIRGNSFGMLSSESIPTGRVFPGRRGEL